MKKTIKLNFLARAAMTLFAMLLTAATAWADGLTGSGVVNDPWVINNVDDWNTFTGSSTYWASGTFVRLGADIPTAADIAAGKSVTTTAGTSDNRYQGTFDGQGHTLTLSLTYSGDNGSDAFIAPFKYINGATIKMLHTAGTITTNGKMAGGIVGDSQGLSTIRRCWSSVTISTTVDGDGTHGGLAGRVDEGTLTITGCLFDGSITGSSTNSCGGFVGWKSDNAALKLNNCLQAGDLTGIGSDGGATFCRFNSGSANFNACYYRTAHGTGDGSKPNQGTQTSASGSDLQPLLGSNWEDSGNAVVPIITANPKDLSEAIITGVESLYEYTSNVIDVTCTVYNYEGNVLTENTQYTLAISPSPVLSPDNYTLTVTAKDNNTDGYFGSKSMGFQVLPAGSADAIVSGYCGDPTVNDGRNVFYLITYSDSGLTLTFYGTGAMADFIPNGQPWNIFYNTDYLSKYINNVVIYDGVTSIGDNAFYGFENLESITIPSCVTSIGQYAFVGCQSLTSITIPAGVTYIGQDAFYYCLSMADIYCYADPTNLTWAIGYLGAFVSNGLTVFHVENAADWSSKFNNFYTNVIFAGGYCGNPNANNGKNLRWDNIFDQDNYSITLRIFKNPDAVGTDFSMADNANFGSTNFNKVIIENGVTSLGANAFKDFSYLNSVIVLAETPPTLGSNAFKNIKNNAVFTVRSLAYETADGWKDIKDHTGDYNYEGCAFTMNIPDASSFDIAYLDDKGQAAVCPLAIPITSSNADVEFGNSGNTWYYVKGDVVIDGSLYFSHNMSSTNLILCDDAKLTVNSLQAANNLNIYVQSNRSGAISISNDMDNDCGIGAEHININGGTITINATGGQGCGIYTQNNIKINGGTITINATGGQGCGIAAANITINGGKVYANGSTFGMCAEIITLGHSNFGDYIYANQYYSQNPIIIKARQTFTYDNGNGGFTTVSGNEVSPNDISGKYLLPVIDNISLTATKIDDNYWTTFYCSHTGYKIDNDENACAYTATVSGETITLNKLGKVIPNNTAVIIVGADNSISMTASTETVSPMPGNDLHGVDVATATGTVLSDIRISSGLGSTTPLTLYFLSNKNSHFGFHDFAGTTVPARKAFLALNGTTALARSLTIVFEDTTTKIEELKNVSNEELKSDAWYSLDGRKLSGKPTAKGVYIHNERKEVIK